MLASRTLNRNAYDCVQGGKVTLTMEEPVVELHRLPACSPAFDPVEGVWKTSRRRTTHNRFYHSTHERDAALTRIFTEFQQRLALIAKHVKRFQ
jgi:transposase